MAMGKQPAGRHGSPLWVTTADLATSAGPLFLRASEPGPGCAGLDAFVEGLCAAFYGSRMGRPSLRCGRYFRMLFIGYFEGLSSERGIAWRVADSLSFRSFLDLDVTESARNHSTAVADASADRRGDAGSRFHVGSRAALRSGAGEGEDGRRRCDDAGSERGDAEHRASGHGRIVRGVRAASRGSLGDCDADARGIGALRPVPEGQEDIEQGLAVSRGPGREDHKMEDGRTHLAHKVEHGVDLETGAIVSVTVQHASAGDSATLPETLTTAAEQVEAFSRTVMASKTWLLTGVPQRQDAGGARRDWG